MRSEPKRPKAAASKKTTKLSRTTLSRVPRSVGFPKLLRVRHRYVDGAVLTSTTGSLALYAFRCNGLFDPNITTTGHQPMYYDNLAAIYNHYVVTACKIELRVQGSFDSTQPMVVGCFVNDDSTVTPSDYTACCEQSTAKYATLAGDKHTGAYITNSWSAKNDFGGSVLANTRLEGTAAADPSEQSVWTIFASTIAGSDSGVVNILVTLHYEVTWRELKDLNTN